MSAVLTPRAELSLPNNASAHCIHSPRSNELLNLHVDASEDVKAEVLVVHEVTRAAKKVFVEQYWNAVMRCPDDTKVGQLLTRSCTIQADLLLSSCSGFVQPVDVPTCKDRSWTFLFPVQIDLKDVIERLKASSK